MDGSAGNPITVEDSVGDIGQTSRMGVRSYSVDGRDVHVEDVESDEEDPEEWVFESLEHYPIPDNMHYPIIAEDYRTQQSTWGAPEGEYSVDSSKVGM